MKRGPKKRVYDRISVSLGKGQKEALENLADSKEVSVADLVRRALDRTYRETMQARKGG